jgi:hypothetical protein
MEENVVNTVEIKVSIKWLEEARRYVWIYDGKNVDPTTGNFTLPACGRTAIIYQLDADCTDEYQLLTVNLDPELCATHEIEHIHVQHDLNAVKIIDRNHHGNTNINAFSLRLVARRTNNIMSGFLSPDPQVTNNPNSHVPIGGPKPK